MTCASSLTEGGQTSSHADDTRALMTAVLLGGISQDDLTVWYLPLLPYLGFKLQGYTLKVCTRGTYIAAGFRVLTLDFRVTP